MSFRPLDQGVTHDDQTFDELRCVQFGFSDVRTARAVPQRVVRMYRVGRIAACGAEVLVFCSRSMN